MSKKNPILFSYIFDKDGKARELETSMASTELKNEGLTWVHLDATNPQAHNWIRKEVDYLDHLIIDALTAEETSPRVTEFTDGLLIILRGVNLSHDDDPEEMVSVRVWIDSNRIITLQRRDMKAIFDVKNHIEQGRTIKTSAEFLYNLIYQIITVTLPFIYDLGDQMDILEEKLLTTHDTSFRKQVLEIRRKATISKRYLAPQKEAIAKLRICQYDWIDDWSKRHFQENFDQMNVMVEEIDEVRDRSHILSDELFNALTEKLNKSMYGLSLVASIFIPLTFFTSIFSVNIAGLPGLNNDSAFMWMIFATAFLTLIQLIIFKYKQMF